MKFIFHLLAVVLLLCVAHSAVHAQVDTVGRPVDTVRTNDSLRTSVHRSQVDTTVVYSARDSIRSDIRNKLVRLWGDAVVVNGDMRLEAAYIEIDYSRNLLIARSRYDSTLRRMVGIPVFRDATQEVSAEELAYNFKTRQASLKAAESKLEDAFYYGAAIRKVDENTFFIKDGVYTTCDEPHPHYWFSSTRMRVEAGDKVFADHLALNVAGVPVFYLPIGVYFPLDRKGKQSGILFPQLPPSVSAQRGVVLGPLGFFWAGNDYIDFLLSGELYGKGGGTATGTLRFRHNALRFASDLIVGGGVTRDTPDDPYSTNVRVRATPDWTITRSTRVNGSIDYATQNFLRNTEQRINDVTRSTDVTTQEVNSSLSLTTQVLGTALSLGYNRNQNIITDRLTVGLPFGITFPTITPFASSGGGEPGIFNPQNLSFGLSISGQKQFTRSDTLADGSRLRDQPFGATISPNLSLPLISSPAFSLSFTPSVRAGLFYRSARKQFVDSVLTIVEETKQPVFNPFLTYSWGLNATVGTKFYFLSQIPLLGVNRHTFSPSITLNYSPDNGTRYRDSLIDPKTNRLIYYTFFDRDAALGYVPSQGETFGATVNLSDIWEAKIPQGDTLPDRKVTLLNFNLNTSYNALGLNGIKWSPINLSASTELGEIGSLSGQATFDVYRRDSVGILTSEFLGSSGGYVHPTFASITFHTGFSDAGFTANVPITAVADSAEARRARFDFAAVPFDEREFFGESVRGISSFRIPWQLDLGVTYSLSERYLTSFRGVSDSLVVEKTLNINPQLSFSLTPTTTIRGSVTWNPLAQEGVEPLSIPAIELTKDLHCWELSFRWQPIGAYRYYGFNLHLKAPQLQDIKIEQERSSYVPE